MTNLPPQKEEQLKAIKKLMAKWLNTQATAGKANFLLTKNPSIRPGRRENRQRP